VVDDISHQGLRALLREQSVSFQRLKTWKQSTDPDFEAKKDRILHLYGLMDGTSDVGDGDPEVVVCVDDFGPLNLQPHPGRQWTLTAGGGRPPLARTGCGTCWPPTTCTDHHGHAEQASMIRRYVAWRNRNARDRRLGEIINRANVA
jgi:hypothetical protein